MTLRNKNTLVIVIIALLFSVFSCSRRSTDYVGMVNDQPITIQQYNTALRNQYESHILKTGFAPNDITWQKITDQAWDNIVEGIVFKQLLDEHDITVTYQEVTDYLMDLENIPEIILNSQHFRDNDVFDIEKYHSSLLESDPIDLSWLTRYYYNIYLPQQKLEARVFSSSDLPERDIREEFIAQNSSANVSIIHFPPDRFEKIIVSDTEVRDYYNRNRTDYALEPYATINYMIIPLIPSRSDSLRTKAVIDSVYTELQDDVDFRFLARNVSDGETSGRGGELPFLPLDELPSRVRSTVQNLPEGSYTRPFSTSDGWVIYMVDSKTRDLIKLREIFIEHNPSEKTQKDKYEDIVNIRNLALELGIPLTADQFDIDYYTAEKLTPENSDIPKLGKSHSIVGRAINSKPGRILEPLYRRDLRSYILIEIVDNQSRDFKPLQAVSDDIRSLLSRKKQHEASQQKAEEYYKRYRYKDITLQAKLQNYPVHEIDFFTINSDIPGENDISELGRNMLAPAKNRYVSEPVELDNGSYIGVVHSHKRPDMNKYSEQREYLKKSLLEEMRGPLYQEWFTEQIKNARVRDWREN